MARDASSPAAGDVGVMSQTKWGDANVTPARDNARAMQQRPPITVALGRFEDIVSRGLQTLIANDPTLELVSSGVPHDQLGPALEAHQPNVAIVNFGGLTSASELRDLHHEHPDTRLIVLANRPTTMEVRQMLSFGATACLSKSSEERDVLHAIHLASRGLHVLPPAESHAYAPSGPELLTPREADVLELLQAGRSNAEIAATLHVGIETVRTHARRIYRKLGVSTRRELRARR
jgi:DNA-binding NarL/FixJ family response regulator